MLAFVVGLQLQRAHVQIAYYTWLSSGLLISYILIRYNFYNKFNLDISSLNSLATTIFATRYSAGSTSDFYHYLLTEVPFIGTGFTKYPQVPTLDSGGLEYLSYLEIVISIHHYCFNDD